MRVASWAEIQPPPCSHTLKRQLAASSRQLQRAFSSTCIQDEDRRSRRRCGFAAELPPQSSGGLYHVVLRCSAQRSNRDIPAFARHRRERGKVSIGGDRKSGFDVSTPKLSSWWASRTFSPRFIEQPGIFRRRATSCRIWRSWFLPFVAPLKRQMFRSPSRQKSKL